jgi:hypothetical protein
VLGKRKRNSVCLKEEEGATDDENDPDFEESLRFYDKKKIKLDQTKSSFPANPIVNVESTSVLQRMFLSVRETFLVFASLARSSGTNFSNIRLSVSTVYRQTIQNRTQITEEVRTLK